MSSRLFRAFRFFVVVFALGSVAGCPSPEEDLDAGGDAGGADAGTDAGSSDAASSDAASSDAASSDGGGADTGLDAPVIGVDAGSGDAGSDAGSDAGRTDHTCTITVSPPSAPESTPFTFTAESDGATCSLRINGSAPMTVGCESRMVMSGAALGVGAHSVELSVDGPLGPTSCVTGFTVTEDTSTTCSIGISPETGTLDTTFVATYASNGGGCSLMLDGLDLGATDCNDMFSGMGSVIGPGTHTGTLIVGGGPGGPTSCSDTFTVTP
jgi:hypothetical protein